MKHIKKFNESNERYFKDDKSKLIFGESELSGVDARLIASKLGLGSGHEEVIISKVGDDEYRLHAVPYYGAPTQSVVFKLTNDMDVSEKAKNDGIPPEWKDPNKKDI